MQENRTTITITKDAKKILDELGKKNESYSDLIMRVSELCNCHKQEETKMTEDESESVE